MRFCPKCGTRLRLKQEEGKKQPKLTCERCGYSTSMGEGRKPEGAKSAKTKPSIKVLEEGAELGALPTTKAECPKCGHDTAYWWMLQTRSADEATTQFYRCAKCNHTWRHYA